MIIMTMKSCPNPNSGMTDMAPVVQARLLLSKMVYVEWVSRMIPKLLVFEYSLVPYPMSTKQQRLTLVTKIPQSIVVPGDLQMMGNQWKRQAC